MTSTTTGTRGSRATRTGRPNTRTRAQAPRPRPGTAGEPGERHTGRWGRVGGWLREASERLDSPVTPYYLLVGATITLVVVGLVMVLSASMVTAYQDDGSSFAVFANQAKFAAIGTVGALVAVRVPVRWWRRLALPALATALVLQALIFVPGLGLAKGGNRNWLKLGAGLSMQPSELTKIGLVLVGALVLANKRHLIGRVGQAVFPYVLPISALTVGLVLAGHDLGTALVLLGIVATVLFVAGVPTRLFALTGLVGAALVAAMVANSDNRMGRITDWLSPACATDPNGRCGQSVHGMYALADGGLWGVGLGASKEKWDWLAEAHNDFIFAIIGEELGLPGTLVVLGLFAAIAVACFRLIARTEDQFVRIATGGVMGWILFQAMVNIGAVIGLLPVIGIPLPLVSAGGSALVTTMLAMGMLISFARQDPAAADALAGRPGVVRRSLAVLPRPRRRTR